MYGYNLSSQSCYTLCISLKRLTSLHPSTILMCSMSCAYTDCLVLFYSLIWYRQLTLVLFSTAYSCLLLFFLSTTYLFPILFPPTHSFTPPTTTYFFHPLIPLLHLPPPTLSLYYYHPLIPLLHLSPPTLSLYYSHPLIPLLHLSPPTLSLYYYQVVWTRRFIQDLASCTLNLLPPTAGSQ